MQTEMIQVQNVKPPQPGSKFKNYSVFGSNNEFFIIDPAHAGQLMPGQTYQLTYEQSGKAKKIIGINGNALQPLAPVAQSMPQQFQQPVQGIAAAGMQPTTAMPQTLPPAQPMLTGAMILKDPLDDLPPILSNVLGHAVAAGTNPDNLPQYAVKCAEAIKAFRQEMARQDPPKEMGHGMPQDGPPMDDFPPDFVQ